ncbi:NAD(P)H-binding protein [Asanoa sp. WMMD1127]|uniref:NAD(P)H-binding protein n=1 Tax=Asanoa sp. WMMD1127 TaxID=3016107 RepID=UPI0024164813|nr:NAD(P)H-binding protein [Asanoa sp. WMMD1127]MDG4826465.1 NAD(P)H-binding protein [Asanoa sp. WMMD1127]
MSERPILVLGATGTTGRRVARLLLARGAEVRGASRGGDVRFDWSDRDTWAPALAGVERMYLMAPHETPVDEAFVGQAVEQGVRRIVLLSSRGIEEMGDQRLLDAERIVRDSGAGWTILRPDWFDQNFDEGFLRPAVLAGALALPVGDARQGFVDADDIAAVAAVALTEDGHEGQTYELTGPATLSFAEALAAISHASGRGVEFRGGDDDYLAQQTALGFPEEQTRAEIAAFAALREQGDATTTDAVPRVTGRAATSFEEYAAEAAAGPAWRE